MSENNQLHTRQELSNGIGEQQAHLLYLRIKERFTGITDDEIIELIGTLKRRRSSSTQEQESNASHPFTECIAKLAKPIIDTPYSKERRFEFSDWLQSHFNLFVRKDGSAIVPVIGIIHGSCARGTAVSTSEHRSDLDGSILFWDEEMSPQDSRVLATAVESQFPQADWGVQIINAAQLLSTIESIDTRENALIPRFGVNRKFALVFC